MWSTLVLYLTIWALIAALARLLFGSDSTPQEHAMPDAARLFCYASSDDDEKESNKKGKEGNEAKDEKKISGAKDKGTKAGRIFAPGSTLLRCDTLSAAQLRKLAYLEEHCCVLPACAATMRVLTSPTAFYEEMLRRIAAAERSIVLSALYIADGPLSQHFVRCLADKLEQWAECRATQAQESQEGGVQPRSITLLLDYNRMKDKHNLAPIQKLLERAHELQQRFYTSSSSSSSSCCPFAVRLFLFQSPCRWNRLVAPFHRVQEALGVQHTKLFLFDHKHIVLTGANLSDDYFTTRMDRYLVIEDNCDVASWFTQLVMTLTELSHPVLCEAAYEATQAHDKKEEGEPMRGRKTGRTVLLRTTRLVMLPNALGADPSEDYDYFVHAAAVRVRAFAAQVREEFSGVAYRLLVQQQQQQEKEKEDGSNRKRITTNGNNDQTNTAEAHTRRYDTVLFPTLQLGRLGIYHDSEVVHTLFASATRAERLFLTSPYLNLYHNFLLALLKGTARVDCVTASVEANGWTGQRGMAGYIPFFYLQLERTFYFLMKDYHCLDRMTLREFAVAGLTFHAKGLWFAHDTNTNSNSNSGTVDSSSSSPRPPHNHLTSDSVRDAHRTSEATRAPNNCEAAAEEEETNTVMYVSPLTAEEKQDIVAPYLVSYGSTNYGHRSVHKDVEAEAFVYTVDDGLREAQRHELLAVLQQSRVVTQERFVRHSRGRFQPVVSLLAQLGQDFL